MDIPVNRAPKSPSFDDLPPDGLATLEPADLHGVINEHRAINERRAQLENPELLRRLRSL